MYGDPIVLFNQLEGKAYCINNEILSLEIKNSTLLDLNFTKNKFNTLLFYNSMIFLFFCIEILFFYFYRDFLLIFLITPVIYLFNESELKVALSEVKAQLFIGLSILAFLLFHFSNVFFVDLFMLLGVGISGLYVLMLAIQWEDIIVKSWYFFVKVVNIAFFVFLLSLYMAEYYGVDFTFDPLFIVISLLLYLGVFSVYMLKHAYKTYAIPLNLVTTYVVEEELTAKEISLKERLDKYFEDSTDYLKITFDLAMLQEQTGIARTDLSRIIKKAYAGNFYQLLAEKRIALAIERLENLQENKTIESVMTECGFSSKSVFNRHFKNITGFTPSEYLESIRLKQIK